MEINCPKSYCLDTRDRAFKLESYQDVYILLNKCSECKAAKVKRTTESLTLRLVKSQFDFLFYGEGVKIEDPALDILKPVNNFLEDLKYEELDQEEYFTTSLV